MGRFVGWIGPVAYLAAVVLAVASCAWFTSVPGVGYGVSFLASLFMGVADGSTTTPLTQDSLDSLTTCAIILAIVWVVAVLWFAWQAAVLHEGVEDERWTSHMLSVALVSRVVLAPLGIFCTVSAALCVGAAIGAGVGAHGGLLSAALWTELVGIVLLLPATLYQICASTRLANRGLLSGTALAWNIILALLPTLGFVAMCGLYVNGREELLASHDRRVIAEALEAVAATHQRPADTVETAAADVTMVVEEARALPEPEEAEAAPEAETPHEETRA